MPKMDPLIQIVEIRDCNGMYVGLHGPYFGPLYTTPGKADAVAREFNALDGPHYAEVRTTTARTFDEWKSWRAANPGGKWRGAYG